MGIRLDSSRFRIVYDRIRVVYDWCTIGFESFQTRPRVVYESYTIGVDSFQSRIRVVYACIRVAYDGYTVGFDPCQNRIRLVYDCIRMAYVWYTVGFDSGQFLKFSRKQRIRAAAPAPRGGIAKIQHSAPTYLWSYLGDCQNSAFVPDWYSSRIRSHTHWHARNPVERIAQMEFSVERFAQLGISVERAWLRA